MGDRHPHGMFGWCDLAVPDVKAATAFYTGLFGWDAEAAEDGSGYTMFSMDGKAVAGLGQLTEDQQTQGIPPVWSSYVAVDDVEAIAAAVTDAGGTIMFGPMAVGPAGSMAFAIDPTGAAIGLWQADEHKGGGVFNEPGAMIWNELATWDVDAAMAFYSAVLGWEYERVPFEGVNYQLIKMEQAKGGDNGGILAMDQNWPESIPSHWMVYFNTADIEATVGKLEELGGTVSVPVFETQVGKMAVVGDDQGGTFSLLQPATHEESAD